MGSRAAKAEREVKQGEELRYKIIIIITSRNERHQNKARCNVKRSELR